MIRSRCSPGIQYSLVFTGDRTNLERKFREWLTRCHATLDKRIRFVGLAEPAMQASN